MDAISTVAALQAILTKRPAQLAERRLQVARCAWIAMVTLSLTVFAAALPARYGQLHAETIHDRLQLASMHPALLPPPLAAWLSSGLYAPAMLGLEVLVMLVCAATALLIFWRRHDEGMALMASLSLVGYGALFLPPLDALAVAHPEWSVLVRGAQAFGLESSLLLFYISPDGSFVPRWTRPLAVIWTIWTVASVVVPSAPFDFLHGRPHVVTPQVFGLPWLFTCLAWYGTGLLAQIVRYRYVSTPQQRQQTKLVLVGWAAVIAFYTVLVVPRVTVAALGEPGPLDLLYRRVGVPSFEAALLLAPIPITISTLRYRLWDVDVVINRALVYGLVTLTIGLVYTGSIIVLEALFRGIAGLDSAAAIVVSTLASTLLIRPVHHRIQNGVDQRFYRHKYDAAQLVEEFSDSVRDEVELNALLNKLIGVVQENIQPECISVVLLPVHQVSRTAAAAPGTARSPDLAVMEPDRQPVHSAGPNAAVAGGRDPLPSVP
jgi:hypothetical protein